MADISLVQVSDTYGFWRGRLNEAIVRINGVILNSSGLVSISSGTISGVTISSSTITGSVGSFTSLNTTTPLPITSGGTGQNSAAGARTALGLGSMATQNSSAILVSGGIIQSLDTPLPIAAGGTGGGSASSARTALGCGDMATQNANNVAITGGSVGSAVNVAGVLGGSIWTTGDVKLTLKTIADAGWVLANDGTIGSAASGATTRANADTQALFTLLWNNIADAWCPVSGGRGASAIADFTAGKTIRLPRTVGRALAISGSGSGLTTRSLGEYLGSEDAIVVAHSHTLPGRLDTILDRGSSAIGFAAYGSPIAETGSTGSSGTGANMQPTTFMNLMVKL